MRVLSKKPRGDIETNLNGYTVSKFQAKCISVISKYLCMLLILQQISVWLKLYKKKNEFHKMILLLLYYIILYYIILLCFILYK